MASVTHTMQDTYSRRHAITIGAALLATLAVLLLFPYVPEAQRVILLIAGAAIGLATVVSMPHARLNAAIIGDHETAGTMRQGVALVLYLSPLILLNIVFPLVSPEIGQREVGGVSLTHIILASSITTPWLAQAACMPAYRGIATLMAEKDMDRIGRRFCEGWAAMYVQSLPLVLLFALPLWLATGWSLQVVGIYMLMCALHLLFVQSLVIANVGQRRGHWAAAWAAYAIALAVVPTWVWLPPVAATLTQLFFIRGQLRHVLAFERLAHQHVAQDLLRGLLLGSVLWADKFVLFLATDGGFHVVVVFMAMLPAVLAYNFYFVNLAPSVDSSIQNLHSAIQGESVQELVSTSRNLSRVVDRSLLRTGALGMVLTLACSLILGVVFPEYLVLSVSVALASWCFLMLTMLGYELDYIGEKGLPQILGGAHLAILAAVFALLPVSAAYGALILGDLVLVAIAWALYKRHWSQPEYTLFWRHATAW